MAFSLLHLCLVFHFRGKVPRHVEVVRKEMIGTYVIIEDMETFIGTAIRWTFTVSSIPPVISKIMLSNILWYYHQIHISGGKSHYMWGPGGQSSELELPCGKEVAMRNVLDTMPTLFAAQCDENFDIAIVVTTDPSIADNREMFLHPVVVQARADAPAFVANNLIILEILEGGMNSNPLFINVNASVDYERENSEVASVVITVSSDGDGPYGILFA
jgi:hypothetical protein